MGQAEYYEQSIIGRKNDLDNGYLSVMSTYSFWCTSFGIKGIIVDLVKPALNKVIVVDGLGTACKKILPNQSEL